MYNKQKNMSSGIAVAKAQKRSDVQPMVVPPQWDSTSTGSTTDDTVYGMRGSVLKQLTHTLSTQREIIVDYSKQLAQAEDVIDRQHAIISKTPVPPKFEMAPIGNMNSAEDVDLLAKRVKERGEHNRKRWDFPYLKG